jgi:hypothetical protein
VSEHYVIDKINARHVCTVSGTLDENGRVVIDEVWDWRPPFDKLVVRTKRFGVALTAFDKAGHQVAVILVDQPEAATDT